MAQSWQYPRWRRMLMQSAMWVVLAATVALAAMIDRHKQQSAIVRLGPPIVCGDVTIQLPKAWVVRTETQQWGLLNAISSVPHASQCTLLVTTGQDPGNELIPRLLRSHEEPAKPKLKPSNEAPPIPRGLTRQFAMNQRDKAEEPITFGSGGFSSEGVLIIRDTAAQDDNGDEVLVDRQLIATALMPDGTRVTLRMERKVDELPIRQNQLGDEADDEEIIKRVAGSVKVGAK